MLVRANQFILNIHSSHLQQLIQNYILTKKKGLGILFKRFTVNLTLLSSSVTLQRFVTFFFINTFFLTRHSRLIWLLDHLRTYLTSNTKAFAFGDKIMILHLILC